MNYVYVITYSTGQYDDRNDYPIRVADDDSKARAFCEAFNQALKDDHMHMDQEPVDSGIFYFIIGEEYYVQGTGAKVYYTTIPLL